MWRYVARRLLVMVPTFLGITFVTFAVIQLAPGDPATLKAQMVMQSGENFQSLEEIIVKTRQLYRLDKPFFVRYITWLRQVVTFDFGRSYVDHRRVLDKISEALPVTLLLNFLSILLIYLISVPIGVLSAVKSGGWFDRFTMLLLFILYSLPSFWVATILVVYLGGADYLNIFPIVGLVSEGAEHLSFFEHVMDIAWHLVLPVLSLTYAGLAFLSRFVRSSMLEVIKTDYIQAVRAKGIPEWQVIFKHALRNAIIPLLTLSATLLPALIGGSVIVEKIFSIPGMGKLGFEAVLSRDYPTIMGIATISAILTLVSLLVADVLYVVADPRISFGREDK